jgi:hypothetical protein
MMKGVTVRMPFGTGFTFLAELVFFSMLQKKL